MRVLITGYSGYVGGHVLAELDRRGHDVTILARAGDAAGLTQADRKFAVTGLDEPERIQALAAEMDAVAHHAASEAPGFAPVNAAAFRNRPIEHNHFADHIREIDKPRLEPERITSVAGALHETTQ